ncbi:MAG: calcium-binding protein, partial [Hassallia sp.]
KIFKVDLSQKDANGFVQKEEVADLLNIQDPNDLNQDGSTSFRFPFQTIEDVLVVDANTILVANDNNYPFSVGRPPGIDNNEIIQLQLDKPLNLDPRVGLAGLNLPTSRILGGNGDDTLYGTSGDDFLDGGEGNNTLYGSEGNDTFLAKSGNDIAYGGAGNDVFFLGNGNNSVYASEGRNRVVTGTGNDLIYAGAGDDTISTGAGDDLIYAGQGNNIISAGTGNDTVYVGSGNDRFILDGGEGAVTIFGFSSNDQITRGSGLSANSNFTVSVSGNDTLVSQGADLLATLKYVQLNTVNFV